MLWLRTLYHPLFTLQILVFKIWNFSGIGRFEETLTVWETGYAEAHAGPFTWEDLNRFYSAVFVRFAQF